MAMMSGAEREWARLGARVRLTSIDQEQAVILKVFPDLRRRKPGALVAVAVSGNGLRADGQPKRKFSAAAKKRMSAGMKKFWAKRKAVAKGKSA